MPTPTPFRCPRGMCKCCAIVASVLIAIAVIVLGHILSKIKLPHFQLDRVSVDHHDDTTAVWDVGFSIDRSVGDSLDVWVRFMAQDYTAESVGSAGNATVSVYSSMPRAAAGLDIISTIGLTIERVTFRCRNYRNHVVEAACKDVEVGGGGAVKGGPILCPVVHEQHI